MKQTASPNVITALKEMITRFGYPERFIIDEFVSYCESRDIELLRSMPYWPRQNGECERQMRSLKKAISISFAEGGDWKAELQKTLLAYRTTPRPMTGQARAKLMLGRKIRDRLARASGEVVLDVFELRDRDTEVNWSPHIHAPRR